MIEWVAIIAIAVITTACFWYLACDVINELPFFMRRRYEPSLMMMDTKRHIYGMRILIAVMSLVAWDECSLLACWNKDARKEVKNR